MADHQDRPLNILIVIFKKPLNSYWYYGIFVSRFRIFHPAARRDLTWEIFLMAHLHKNLIFLLFGLLALFLAGCGGSDDPTDPGDGGDGGETPDTTPPQILQVFPEDGALIHDYLSGSFQINFSEAMDQATAEGQVTVTGASTVELMWLDDFSLEVFCTDLPQGSITTLTVGTGLADLAGNTLAQAFTATYTVVAEVPVLLDYTPGDGISDVNRATMIDLHFSNNMNLASLQSGIVIEDDSQTTYGFTVESTGVTTYRLDPTEDFAATALVTVTVTTGVTDEVGTALGQEITFGFFTGETADSEPPTIVSIDPASGSAMPADQGQITITFSEPVAIDSIDPVRMNGQFFWVQAQMPGEPSLDGTGTVLTVPLPAELPAGLPLEVVLAGYADVNGNVQDAETAWSVTVAGEADPYPVSDGHRYIMVGDWEEGPLGSDTPTSSDEHWIFFEQGARQTAGQWELREYGWEFDAVEYYEILEVSASSVDLLGFADLDGGEFVEFIISSPLTMAELPMSAGNSWSSSGTVTMPDATFTATMAGTAVGQEDLAVPGLEGIEVTWTDVWRLTRTVTITSGGETVSTEEGTLWFAPGIGLVREVYREENYEPGETGWYQYDNWLQVETP
jgi:hypothetical protein